MHFTAFHGRSTSANLNTDRAPPSPNLLADICTCGVFPAASPQPTSIPTGYRHPQICLQTFAPVPFSPPLLLNQPQYRRGTATPKFACRHLHLCRFPNRFSSTNLNADGVPPSPNLLAAICTCGVFPAASPQPTSIPTGYRHPRICLQTFAPVPFSQPLHLRQPQYRWDTALLKFACSHLHLRRFPHRFTSPNLNTDGASPPSNLLADICMWSSSALQEF